MGDITLTAYLKQIIKLESTIMTQRAAIQNLEYQSRRYGIRKNFQKPKRPQIYSSGPVVGCGTLLGLFLFLGLMAVILTSIDLDPDTMLLTALIGVVAAIGFVIYKIIRANKKEQAENEAKEEAYQRELDRYNKLVEQDAKRVEREVCEAKRLLAIRGELIQQMRETEKALNDLYAVDVIFPKYHNLVAVCSFYEYLMAGRCSRLTGHDGAYNIYETEARLDRILTKIDVVIQKLDQIRDNQWMLYDTIQQGNGIAQRLLNESIKQSRISGRIADNAALAAYNAGVAADNARASAMISAASYLRES